MRKEFYLIAVVMAVDKKFPFCFDNLENLIRILYGIQLDFMGKKNGVSTIKIQVSVDKSTDAVLKLLVPMGVRGKNKSEVAYGIIREWIWHNQENLNRSGISVKQKQK